MESFNKPGFGTTRKVTGAGYGMRDWLMQRVTAVLMVLFTLVVLVACLNHGDVYRLGMARLGGYA
jgi:succinate dehydrogenase / fumarate reductase, membrane anchor subunit